MAKAGGKAAAELEKGMLYHDIELAATKAMFEDVEKAIEFFSIPQKN